MDQDRSPTLTFRRFDVLTFPQEWLITNGIGGYAMGTLPGINMRRYHGLLVAAAAPPVRRVVALHSVIEVIDILRTGAAASRTYSLSSQHFGEKPLTHPEGARHIVEVTVDPPGEIRWRYAIDGVELIRTLRLLPGRNCAMLSYEMRGGAQALIRLRPLVALRDFHSLNRPGDEAIRAVEHDSADVRVVRGDLGIDLALTDETNGTYIAADDWWRNFAYVLDRERGQEFREDVFTPGRFEIKLSDAQPRGELSAELVLPQRCEVDLHSHSRPLTPLPPHARDRLASAASQFIVHRRVEDVDSTSIIAGYPWFADWGRDTMICIPGLLLATGRREEAERCLITFAHHMRNGLIPNRFDDHASGGGIGGAHYNTVDASLWFIHAVFELLSRHPLAASRGELIGACRAVVSAYRMGTDFNIGMDERDSLIAAGDASTQLTWMDAQRDGVTFTPRHGKPIEINALWHHALHALASMTDRGDEADELRSLATQVARSIQRFFWCERIQCCYDVLAPGGEGWIGDEAIRPNQIFAVNLEPSPLGLAQQKSIVRIVKEKLLTPYGLRTLDPAHPQYKGRFEGDLFARDGAYHQGTVWPWLIGPYCEALLRVNRFSPSAKREAAQVIEPLLAQLDAPDSGKGCVGQVAEVYDGDEPHRPGGCPAQAWSVAELLRVMEMLDTD